VVAFKQKIGSLKIRARSVIPESVTIFIVLWLRNKQFKEDSNELYGAFYSG
jgi:hypothetical protein